MKVDVTSDLHVDFWIDVKKPATKQKKLITEWIAKLLPKHHRMLLLLLVILVIITGRTKFCLMSCVRLTRKSYGQAEIMTCT